MNGAQSILKAQTQTVMIDGKQTSEKKYLSATNNLHKGDI